MHFVRFLARWTCVLALTTFFSASASAEAERCIKTSLVEISQITSELKKRELKISDIFSLMVPSTRQAIRKYYQIGKSCPEANVLDQIYSDLESFGYPLEYLPKLFGRTMEEVGLRFFQIGDQWDREVVVTDQLSSIEKKVFRNVAVGGLVKKRSMKDGKPQLIMHSLGTGFLIELKPQQWAIVTARHVFKENADGLSEEEACLRMNWHFPSGQKISFRGKRWIPLSKDLDVALCELETQFAPPGFFESRGGLEFERQPLVKRAALLTMGFGVYQSPKVGKISMERSEDCRLFSVTPTRRDGKWSLPTGCDVSSADSGSPMVNAQSGKVIGVVWGTTQIKKVVGSEELDQKSEQIPLPESLWQELSLITPASKILEELSHL